MKPISVSTSTLSGVAIATWAAATPGVSCTVRLTWSRVTESAYAPGRSSTWVRHAARTPSVSQVVEGEPRAGQQPGAGRGADPHQRRRRGRARSAVPSAASQAPSSGSTSPCRAQSSRVAESRVVRPAWAADRAGRRRGWRTPAARWVASQPHRTSSPSGVSPSPRPTRPAHGVGVDAVGRRGCDELDHGGRGDGRARWPSSPSCRGSLRGPVVVCARPRNGPPSVACRRCGGPPPQRTPKVKKVKRRPRSPGAATGARTAPGRPRRRPGRRTGRSTSTYTASGPRWTHRHRPVGSRPEQVADPRRGAHRQRVHGRCWNDGALMLSDASGVRLGLPM